MKHLLIICPLALVAALLAFEPQAPPETMNVLGKERVIQEHPNGMRSIDISDTPISIMATRINADGQSESRCLGSSAELEAFENFAFNKVGSEK